MLRCWRILTGDKPLVHLWILVAHSMSTKKWQNGRGRRSSGAYTTLHVRINIFPESKEWLPLSHIQLWKTARLKWGVGVPEGCIKPSNTKVYPLIKLVSQSKYGWSLSIGLSIHYCKFWSKDTNMQSHVCLILNIVMISPYFWLYMIICIVLLPSYLTIWNVLTFLSNVNLYKNLNYIYGQCPPETEI